MLAPRYRDRGLSGLFLSGWLFFLLTFLTQGAMHPCSAKGRVGGNTPSADASGKDFGKRIPPLPSDKAAWDRYIQEGWDSPFGLDYVFALGESYRDPEFVYSFGGEIGIRWANFSRIRWKELEPKAPKDGKHTYEWAALDDGVRKWQEYGVHILVTLNMKSGWGTAPPRDEVFVLLKGLAKMAAKSRTTDFLPKPEHMQDFRDFIHNLVERYDGDGVEDMPGLRYPILYYQVGNEYNNEVYWGGTAEDYGVLLKETAQAARKACKEVKLLLSGVAFDDPSLGFYDLKVRPRTKAYLAPFEKKIKGSKSMSAAADRMNTFSLATMKMCQDYDILDVRGPSFGKIHEARKLLEQFGCGKKEIWAAEVYSNLPIRGKIASSVTNYPTPKRSLEYRKILERPNHKEFEAVNSWYRAMQAAHVVRSTMTALHGGVKKVMIGYALDKQTRLAMGSNGSFTGFRSVTFNRHWPAAYTYGQLIEKLDGFKSCKRLSLGNNDLFVYECKVRNNRKVWVVFFDDLIAQNHDESMGSTAMSLPFGAKTARVTHAITKIGQKEPEVETIATKGGKLNMTITEYPVFIEAL